MLDLCSRLGTFVQGERPHRDRIMTLVVLYFAALRELLGTSEETLSELPRTLTIGGLAELLVERHPTLAPHLGSVRFALNETFVDLGAQVTEGDTVALIPPVSGG